MQRMTQTTSGIGDSYVGVISTEQFKDGVDNWDLQFSPDIVALDHDNLERVASDPNISAGLYREQHDQCVTKHSVCVIYV